ncbi:sulfide/dihydroorotate dehydrogenase-like FAD/NAD-binding protein [Oceanirhabdus seepicola]|uniref:Sulfide/dihydroorotate dehydrogenase-like FAD/NAD-binding protein n=1 Tax=Oceanirhabdus seepicola TaxID=2828781 RepID=A0A9J6PER8_9CLOT|nr:sulfide/dihydroorotate dehydrogenase-like FAD/NAD-binding protein [Oceanirhabdus seepicola]MCM1992776.1 sulfide/dihydroorotate dehydrogenase-like FAD/NAD-binding protein [Oceanirhabdus seepicola]
MGYQVYKCIDAGTEFCPCHLSENNQCILCSALQDKDKCDCEHWSGVCIYQRFIENGKKATETRKYYQCDIVKKDKIGKGLLKLIIKVPEYLSDRLTEPGSFVFLKNPSDKVTFDVPIAVMEVNRKKCTITVVLKILGVKTKRIEQLMTGEKITVKGPFWNGILGLRHIKNLKDSTVLVIARGIGQAPMIPPLKELYNNNNKIITIIDKGKEGVEFIRPYLDRFSHVNIYTSVIDKGIGSRKFEDVFKNIVVHDKVSLVHCDTGDFIIKKVMRYIKEIEKEKGLNIDFSCCNNFKMCCGEGICGCCTNRRDSNIKRMCKYQGDPKDILEECEH